MEQLIILIPAVIVSFIIGFAVGKEREKKKDKSKSLMINLPNNVNLVFKSTQEGIDWLQKIIHESWKESKQII